MTARKNPASGDCTRLPRRRRAEAEDLTDFTTNSPEGEPDLSVVVGGRIHVEGLVDLEGNLGHLAIGNLGHLDHQ